MSDAATLKREIFLHADEPALLRVIDRLPASERMVIAELGMGLTIKEIAGAHDIDPKTVYRYRDRVQEKLGHIPQAKLLTLAAIWVRLDQTIDKTAHVSVRECGDAEAHGRMVAHCSS